jgi:hypothetical protein
MENAMPMSLRSAIAAIFVALFFAACGKTSSDHDELSPLDSFKPIAEKCHGAIIDSDNVVPGKVDGFVRTAITPGPKSFDVKKTDSLVSPYVAYIDLNFVEKAIAAPTEEAARAWSGVAVVTVQHWHLVYAMQDGKWRLQEELYSFALPGADIPEGVPTKMALGALAESIPAATVCMPTALSQEKNQR